MLPAAALQAEKKRRADEAHAKARAAAEEAQRRLEQLQVRHAPRCQGPLLLPVCYAVCVLHMAGACVQHSSAELEHGACIGRGDECPGSRAIRQPVRF